MPTEIVETVMADSLAALRAARDRVTDADIVELRLDGVRDVDVAGAIAGRTRPVVVTCRPVREGGRFDGSEAERLGLLGEAMRLGAEFVDVEWRADRRRLPADTRAAIVLSHHDFDGVPADLGARVRAMSAEAPALIKVSVMAARVGDCVRLRDLIGGSTGTAGRVAIAMGAAGQITRVFPAWIGSTWTYAGAAAPGQIDAATLVRGYRVRETTAATAVYALCGHPIAHAASPAMHNAAFAAAGLDAVYVPIATSEADECLRVLDAIGARGASVTAPLKTPIGRRLGADPSAGAGEAINTIRRDGGGWATANFDVDAFLLPFDRRGIRLAGLRTVVLGAGGAARAVIAALRSRSAVVAVSARRHDRAIELARVFGVEAVAWPPPPAWDLLVNATPVGTAPAVAASPIDRAHVRGPRVYDLVYNPPETQLLAWAREAGAETIGGLEMLVGQACRQFEWWTGRPAPADVVERAAEAFLAGHAPAGILDDGWPGDRALERSRR